MGTGSLDSNLISANFGQDENAYRLPSALFDSLPVAVYTCNTQGYITAYNKAAVNFWEAAPQVNQNQWFPFFKLLDTNQQYLSPDVSPMAVCVKNAAVTEAELMVEKPDGKKLKIKASCTPLFNGDATSGVMVTLIPLNNYLINNNQQALLASIVDSSEDAIVSKTLDGIITSWNKAAEKLFGYSPSEIIGKHISILIPNARLGEEDIIIGNVRQGKRIDHFETMRLTKAGKEIPISLSVSPVLNDAGEVIGASKIARDVSERKKAYEHQARLAAIVDTSDDTILSKTLEGIITSWNNAAEAMFGYTADEVIGKHISILIPQSRLKEEEYIIGQIAQNKRVDHFETIRISKYGREIPISLSVSPILDHNGQVIGASKIARDISIQKTVDENTRSYTRRLEIINTVIKVIAEELDLNKILQKVTDITTELTGAEFGAFFYNAVDESGESYLLYTLSGAPREAFERFGMPRNTAVFHATFSGEGVVRVGDITKDLRYGHNPPHNGMPAGHLPVVSYLAVPVILRSGEVIGGLFFGHSKAGVFTSEHESLVGPIAAQAAIGLDNAKLYKEVKTLNEKKDEFIGLASHELKTPLTSITGYLQILERMPGSDSSKKFVSKTVQQVKKLSALVSDLLDVSKIEAGKLQLTKEDFDFRVIVDDAVELIQHSHNTHRINVHTDVNSLQVYGDPQRIEQVVINLLTNAIKYSPMANEVELMLTASANEVKLSVKDFGIGIAPDKFSQLFSRFYRVEELNPNISGLGIGLYISHEIISRHEGNLWVESEPDKGSTFWFTLPLKNSQE
ncbi:PAS domain S-box protein [Mucilaginibacter sp. PAMB04274]|uniref:PAS domain S-box protein n=1 Tax=Mucilaginibacter sp. PAMB04274 TaxID=3138568 RepID=UPI0031F6D28B